MNTSKTLLTLAAVAFLSGSVSAATMTDVAFSIEATSTLGTGSWELDASEGVWDEDIYTWTLASDVELTNESGAVLATLKGQETSIFIQADPVVSIAFAATAGAADTSITITSASLGFAPISPAIGRASAGMTLTDNNGDGASLTGNLAGGTKSYRAHYNGLIPAGTLFANLVDNQAAGSFGTSSTSEASPAVGFAAIGGAVSSMQTQFDFTLSAQDSASGTSVFVVIPEPASAGLLLLAMGLLVGARSNRS